MHTKNTHLKTWVTVDTNALAKNIRTLQKKLPQGVASLVVVKGDAYGHGMLEVAKIAISAGVDFFAVFDIHEAIALRRVNKKIRILVLRGIFPDEIALAIQYDLDVVLSTHALLDALQKKKITKPLRVHVMVDTGLGRDGFLFQDAHAVATKLHDNHTVYVVGLASHFSASESRAFDGYTRKQSELLKEWQIVFAEHGMYPIVHLSSTAGVFVAKEFARNMVRFGIGVYGLWPSTETKELARGAKLVPVLSWKTVVNEIKKIPAGSAIGYNLTHRTERARTVAIVPVGYADGYPRAASNKGTVLVRGKRARILGRVMMNMFVIDVTHIRGVSLGDTVTLIGTDGKEHVSAEELAEASGTINYEIVTRIDKNVKRLYL